MHPARADRAFLPRLEAAIADAVGAADRVTVAYSGGLASTVVAASARKRVDVRCLVAGTGDSPDVRAANIAKDYLDYRVDVVPLSRPIVLGLVDEIADDHPGLTKAEKHALVPLWAVLAKTEPPTLSGFGPGRFRPQVREVLRDVGVSLPIAIAGGRFAVTRPRIRDVAKQLGLPTAFTEVRRRAPERGAGIVEILRSPDNR